MINKSGIYQTNKTSAEISTTVFPKFPNGGAFCAKDEKCANNMFS